MVKIFSRMVATVCFLLLAVVSYAKPAPPQNLTAILEEVSELEEKFEGGNWTDARATLGEIQKMYADVYRSFEKQVPADLHKRFIASISALGQFLESEDEEKSEKSFIAMQVLLFEIMGHFDYKVHPVIQTLKKYIGEEAQESLEKKDYSNVLSELKEVVTFFSKNTTLFQQNGIPNADLQLFMSTLGEAIKQARNKDATPLKSSLDDLERQIDALQKSFAKS